MTYRSQQTPKPSRATTPRQRHARWQAQHASQHLPVRARKPVAMLALRIGDEFANNAARVWTGDECCDTCGHYACSCPLARALRKERAEPTRALDVPRCSCTHEHGDSDCAKHPTCFRCHMIIGYSDGEACRCAVPERDELAAFRALDVPAAPAAVEPRFKFKIGDLALLTFAYSNGHVAESQRGRIVRVVTDDVPASMWVRDSAATGAEFEDICLSSRDLEPAPASAPVDEWTPPAPWARDPQPSGSDDWTAPSSDSNATGAHRVRRVGINDFLFWKSDGMFDDKRGPVLRDGDAPTLAQACCAAHGISIVPASCTDPRDRFTAIGPDSRSMGVSGPDAESCARAALAAHHARSKEPVDEWERAAAMIAAHDKRGAR